MLWVDPGKRVKAREMIDYRWREGAGDWGFQGFKEVGGARCEAEETTETTQECEWRWKLMRITIYINFTC
jgi:hypothetical protein